MPVASDRSLGGNHSAVALIAAGKLPLSPRPRKKRATPKPKTELTKAWKAGADYVKVFPCSAMGGASYLKALLAPFPFLKLIPTGGVTLETAESFLRAGARALGVGSDLVNLAAITAGRPETITETARAYLQVLAAMRAQTQSQK